MNISCKTTLYLLFFMNFLLAITSVNATLGIIRIDLTNCYAQLKPEIQEQIHLYLGEYSTNLYLEFFEKNIEYLRIMRLKEHIASTLQAHYHQLTLITLPYQHFLPTVEPNPLIIGMLAVDEYYGRYEHNGRIYFNVPLVLLVLAITPPQADETVSGINSFTDSFSDLSIK